MDIVRCSALLFDMDGVLINSIPAVTRVWTDWAIRHGFNPEETVKRAHGRPSIVTVREYLPHADHEAENKKIERQEIEDVEGILPLPGALELLGSLPPERWAIVTSCTAPLAEARIRAAGLPIPTKLLTASDVVQGKPYPEPYLKGAALLGFPASDCIVAEDVIAGVQAGKAAGARVVALQTTIAKRNSLQAAGADWVVPNLSAVKLANVSPDKLELAISDRG